MRQLTRNWLEEYVDLIQATTQSPVSYHFWSGASIVAATLKRHVWIDRVNYKLMPNLFVILVGRPGLGKGEAANPALSLLTEAGTANVLSDRVTMEFVLEKLSNGFAAFQYTPQGISPGKDSSSIIFSPELSIFISASQATLPVMCDLWDAREGAFLYGTRNRGEKKINSPCVTLLGASTQEWLHSSIPVDAVGGGFTRRVNFVYANERSKNLPWPVSPNGMSTKDKLINDLKHIATLRGQFSVESAARKVFEDFSLDCKPNDFDDEITAAYVTSAPTQVLKLSMINCVCEDDSLLIKPHHVENAIACIEACKRDLSRVFRACGDSDFAGALDRVLRFIETKGYVSRHDILRCNWRHVSSQELDVCLMTLRDGHVINEEQVGGKTYYKIP